MPEIRDVFKETELLDLPALHRRRDELTSSAPGGDYSLLSDDVLSELLAINRALRKKVAANAGETKRKSAAPRTKKPSVSLDEML